MEFVKGTEEQRRFHTNVYYWHWFSSLLQAIKLFGHRACTNRAFTVRCVLTLKYTHDSRIGITHVQCIVSTYQYTTQYMYKYLTDRISLTRHTHAHACMPCMHASLHTCTSYTQTQCIDRSTLCTSNLLKSRHEVDTWRNKLQEKRIGESNLHTKICIKLVIRGV